MVIKLTEPEQRLARYMGQQRYVLSRKAGVEKWGRDTMSGGRWNYGHERLFSAATTIEKMAARNPYGDDAATLAEFRRAVRAMRIAAIYWRRIDWLVSADDSAEAFHQRLREELDALDNGTFDSGEHSDPYGVEHGWRELHDESTTVCCATMRGDDPAGK